MSIDFLNPDTLSSLSADQTADLAALAKAMPKIPEKDKEFAASLVAQAQKKGFLSDKQWYWVKKLLTSVYTGVQLPGGGAPEPINVGHFGGVIDLFKKAAEHLKKPKIRLLVEGKYPVVAKLYDPSPTEKNWIKLTSSTGYSTYYGKVSPLGKWFPSKATQNHDDPQFKSSLEALLEQFADTPAIVAQEQGKLTGHCCFCGLKLEEAHSVAAGFGPVCAKNFGIYDQWKNAVKKTLSVDFPVDPMQATHDAMAEAFEKIDPHWQEQQVLTKAPEEKTLAENIHDVDQAAYAQLKADILNAPLPPYIIEELKKLAESPEEYDAMYADMVHMTKTMKKVWSKEDIAGITLVSLGKKKLKDETHAVKDLAADFDTCYLCEHTKPCIQVNGLPVCHECLAEMEGK